jgi:IMP dehydrogenase
LYNPNNAGFGATRISAIIECATVGQDLNVPVIADGGIRYSRDLTKSLAARARTVLEGSLLEGADESNEVTIDREGRCYKTVRTMASISANMDRKD